MKFIIVMTLTLFLLSGCNVKENTGSSSEEGTSTIEVNGKEFLLPDIDENLNKEEQYEIGEPFSIFDPKNGERIVTIENCKVFDNFEDAGLDIESLNPYFIENQEILQNEAFVLLDIKIENISSKGFIDGYFYLDEMMVGNNYYIKNNIANELAYFSEAPQQTEYSKNYSAYTVDIGDTLQFQAGWFLDTNSIKGNDYLLQIGLSNSDYQYVKLTGESK